jgi:ATP-binding cassette, subfamily G (WHITE), member 2, PDR
LAAKPSLLIFLDEPTSGLDSQSSWSIIVLLKKLAASGQAVLATIHQPSAVIFQEFDRLLFLAKGGKTVYFGDIGSDSRTLLDYFEAAGARHCAAEENPAEYMLEVVDAKKGSTQDWPTLWTASSEAAAVHKEIDRIRGQSVESHDAIKAPAQTYAQPLRRQFALVLQRIAQQYWRTPSYIFGKLLLCVSSSIWVGLTFLRPGLSQTDMQNTIFALFMVLTVFTPLVQQVSGIVSLFDYHCILTKCRSCPDS